MRLYFYIMEKCDAAAPQNFSLQEMQFYIEKLDINLIDFKRLFILSYIRHKSKYVMNFR